MVNRNGKAESCSLMKLGGLDEVGESCPEIDANILAVCTHQEEEIVGTYIMHTYSGFLRGS
jgi:hypothetical protein